MRALDIAAVERHAETGWTLLCEGAQAVPTWGREQYKDDGGTPLCDEKENFKMLLFSAMRCDDDMW